ncbi:MAG: phytoene/squalene synthase family protein [Gaiellaceae bacterium]
MGVLEASPMPVAAYAACRRMLRRHDPSYYLAVLRLPRERRAAVHALYGFVRGADEIVDGAGRRLEPRERRAALDSWEDELERGLATGRSSHRVIAALVHAAAAHDLPLGELRTYMASMRMDCGPLRIQTRAELDRYMQGSAASVGRIMAAILGAPSEAERLARLGVAFQLTNFLRDVREDYALDRIYLPADELDRLGVQPADIAAATATPALRQLVADEVGRAHRLFESAPALAAAIPSCARGIRLAHGVYAAVLDRIERNGFDVLGRTSRPRPWHVAHAAVRAW